MKLQFLSDLHLEVYKRPFPIEPVAPYLALIGDICTAYHPNLIPFLERCGSLYEQVLYIPGNHEYYGHTLTDVNAYLSDVCQELNITYLPNNMTHIDDIQIVGCTLWSEPTPEAFGRKNKNYWLKDFSREDMIQEHQRHVYTLKQALRTNQKTLFLTHYAPLVAMNGIYQHFPSTSMFTTPLNSLFQPPLVAWLCGHVHQNLTIYENSIPCISNCFGYPNELEVHQSFDLQKCFHLDSNSGNQVETK